VQRTQSERLIGHILRDSTAIEAREKPQPKVRPAAPPPRRSHHKKIEKAEEPGADDEARPAVFRNDDVDQMLADLPRACDVGCKTNSKGSKSFWIGSNCIWMWPMGKSHQWRADFGLAQRYAGSRAAVAADGAARD